MWPVSVPGCRLVTHQRLGPHTACHHDTTCGVFCGRGRSSIRKYSEPQFLMWFPKRKTKSRLKPVILGKEHVAKYDKRPCLVGPRLGLVRRHGRRVQDRGCWWPSPRRLCAAFTPVSASREPHPRSRCWRVSFPQLSI